MNIHRARFYDCIKYSGKLKPQHMNEDEHLLGQHIYSDHGMHHKDSFNEAYTLTILETVGPNDIDVKEHLWVQKLQTVAPYGLNSHDPFGILLLF